MTAPETAESAPTELQNTAAGRNRHKRILAAALSGAAGKGIALIVNAAIVPIAIRALGPEQYGILITITSTVTMIVVLDIGIANTLTNLIAEAYARDDKTLAGQYFTTAFWTVALVVAGLAALGIAIWPHLDWRTIFHLSTNDSASQVALAFACACAICLIAIPAGLASRIMAGYQELHASNWFTSSGSLLSLMAVAVTAHFHGGLPIMVTAFALGPVAANASCLVWICGIHKPWMAPRLSNFTSLHLGKIFKSGTLFFLTQIAALVILNTDNLIIAHYLGPADVTPYNVTWRLAGYGSSILSLITPALWPAYAEAYLRHDRTWIRQTYTRTQLLTVAALGSVAIALLLAGKTIIKIWAGPVAVPSTTLLALMSVWMVIFGVTLNQGSLMGATGRVGKQAVGALLAAIANLVLSVIWVQSIGVVGVILASVVSYMLFIVSFQGIEVRKILRGK